MDLPVYELVINTGKLGQGVHTISIVDNPAHESNFIAFAAEEEIKLSAANEDKKLITGAALIPDTLIYRSSPEPHYVRLSAETIARTQEAFAKSSNNWAVNFAHNSSDTSDVSIIEQWIKMDSEKDKSNALGLDLPVGSWVVTMKVDDAEKWTQIKKKGLLNGFSIEAFFDRELVEDPLEKPIMQEKINELETKFAAILAENKSLKASLLKFEEVKVEDKPVEVVPEKVEEVKVEEVVAAVNTFTQEQVDAMIADAIKAYVEANKTAEDKVEDVIEEKVESIMSSQVTSARSEGLINFLNKIKNK